MRKTIWKLTVLSLAALASLTFAVAGEDVDRTFEVEPDGTLEIELGAGTLNITAWDRNEVQIRGTVPEGEDMFEVDADDDTVSIEVALPEDDWDDDWDWDDDCDDCEDDDCDDDDCDDDHEHHGKHGGKHGGELHLDADDTDLEIMVPRGFSVEVEGIAANVNIEGVSGEIAIEAISGDVTIDGDVSEIEIEVVSGEIEITGGTVEEAEVSAVSGSITFRSDLSSDASVALQTVSGSIVIYLPSNASCRVAAQTFNGDIDSAFGQRAKKQSEWVPAESMQFTLGDGDAEVALQSFNGDIKIRED